MTPALWTISVFLVASTSILFALTFSSRSRARAVARLSRSVGLAVPSELAETLAQRAARRARASAIGSLLGTAVVIASFMAGIISSAGADGTAVDIWLLIGGYFVGLAIAAMFNALSENTVVPDGARIARSGAVSLSDYVAPIDRVGARISVGLGIAVLLGAIILHEAGLVPENPVSSVSALVIALAIVSLAIFEIGARRIIRRAQPAGSPTELAWDDAMRAQNIRDVATAPISLGLWGALAVLVSLISQPLAMSAPGNIVFVALMAAFFGILGLSAIAAAVSIGTKPQQHYLRRLWPAVAEGLALSRSAK